MRLLYRSKRKHSTMVRIMFDIVECKTRNSLFQTPSRRLTLRRNIVSHAVVNCREAHHQFVAEGERQLAKEMSFRDVNERAKNAHTLGTATLTNKIERMHGRGREQKVCCLHGRYTAASDCSFMESKDAGLVSLVRSTNSQQRKESMRAPGRSRSAFSGNPCCTYRE